MTAFFGAHAHRGHRGHMPSQLEGSETAASKPALGQRLNVIRHNFLLKNAINIFFKSAHAQPNGIKHNTCPVATTKVSLHCENN